MQSLCSWYFGLQHFYIYKYFFGSLSGCFDQTNPSKAFLELILYVVSGRLRAQLLCLSMQPPNSWALQPHVHKQVCAVTNDSLGGDHEKRTHEEPPVNTMDKWDWDVLQGQGGYPSARSLQLHFPAVLFPCREEMWLSIPLFFLGAQSHEELQGCIQAFL